MITNLPEKLTIEHINEFSLGDAEAPSDLFLEYDDCIYTTDTINKLTPIVKTSFLKEILLIVHSKILSLWELLIFKKIRKLYITDTACCRQTTHCVRDASHKTKYTCTI